jgi:ribonucleoside-triphosphate reductase
MTLIPQDSRTISPIALDSAVLESYPEFPGHMTSKGKFTYLRTYSRYLPRKERREFFRETMHRASEYSINLELSHRIKNNLPADFNVRRKMKQELHKLYDNMFNLRQALSGRTNWVGGAENGVADKYPLANFNCSFTITEEWQDIVELFYLLLVGTGVGFKTIGKMCEKLPAIRNDFTLEHAPYKGIPKPSRLEHSEIYHEKERPEHLTIYVGDSKEGWCEALKWFLVALTDSEFAHIKNIKFNYNSVRPKGERLKTFGGTASGHEPLQIMFDGFEKVLKNQIDPLLDPLEEVAPGWVKVRPIHITDMCNLVGYNVVVGGVRRTAEIGLGEEGDWEFIFAKYGINGIWGDDGFEHHEYLRKRMIELDIPVPRFWDMLAVKYYYVYDPVDIRRGAAKPKKLAEFTDPADASIYAIIEGGYEDGEYFPFPCNEKRGLHHRRMSNNSIGFLRQPPQEFLDFLFEVMQKEGEPGFVNLYELAVRRLHAMGNMNPSEEEILALAYFIGVNPCGEINLRSKGVCNLTTVNVKSFVHNGVLDEAGLMEAQRLSARAGLRMTLVTLELPKWDKVQQEDRLLGCSLTGWKAAMGALEYDTEQEERLLVKLRKVANDEATEYSLILGVNRPLLVTSVKPEGTLTLVMNAETSGLHFPKVRRGIRRIRINKEDALAKAVLEQEGWVINPDVGTEGETHEDQMRNARTLVIDFPDYTDAKLTELDVNVHMQFDSYFRFQRSYTDHNSSNTIVLEPHEWLEASKIVHEKWNDFVGVSFLAKDGGSYKLAPFENNPEAYESLTKTMKDFDMEKLHKHETGEASEIDEDCQNGACAVR